MALSTLEIDEIGPSVIEPMDKPLTPDTYQARKRYFMATGLPGEMLEENGDIVRHAPSPAIDLVEGVAQQIGEQVVAHAPAIRRRPFSQSEPARTPLNEVKRAVLALATSMGR